MKAYDTAMVALSPRIRMSSNSITTLVRAPEILDEILQYLSDTDAVNIASTCKALYYPCSRYLWATLRVTTSIYSTSGRAVSSNFDLLPIIQKYWSESNLIQYTRHVVLGRVMNHCSEKSKALMKLLETQVLLPNRIDLEISLTGHSLEISRKDEVLASLHDLKEYSESRSAQEFGILLQSNVVYSLPQLVDLPKVTKLTLGLLVLPRSEYSVGQGIEDFTKVLKGSVNLTFLSWEGDAAVSRRCHISEIWGPLQKLQAAFAELRRLSELKIRRYLFHPSFFLTPPENVRALSLDCIASEDWWRSFATCPLTSVETLSINYITGCDSSSGLRGFLKNERPIFNTIELGGVAVRSLKSFSCNRPQTNIPLDLKDCILCNNPELDLESRKAIQCQGARKILDECFRLFDEDSRACQQQAVDRYVKKFARGYEVDVEEALKFVAEWVEMVALLVQVDGLQTVSDWVREKENSESIDNGGKDTLETTTKDVSNQYSSTNLVEKARNFVVPLVYEFSGALQGTRERAVDALALKLAQGEEVAVGVAMRIWAEEASVRIQNVRHGIRDLS
ncbi:hypothetical protein TWF730_005535 [Orbilia blumenaviensis]|uniref:F-box domain-containing protein n=1 Tax=Orbilia blumenaviensis TaxID=1796055 RepID=A0AAV9VPT7_9PEZI